MPLDYIKRNSSDETVIKQPWTGRGHPGGEFSLRAIEEAVVNAVYHRGYDVREPVEVRITHDELVVLSYPGPDRSVSWISSGPARPFPAVIETAASANF